MSVLSTTTPPGERRDRLDDNDHELALLIKEARRLRRRRVGRAGCVATVLLALVVTVVYETGASSPPPNAASPSAAAFIDAFQHANVTRFAATYHLTNYLYFQSGSLVMSESPSPPGTKATPNVDGYAGTGREAFVFRGPDHLLAQWIRVGTNVSACERPRDPTGPGPLTCSTPTAYIPSNAFAMQDTGFVPTYVADSVTQFASVRSHSRAHPTTSTLYRRVSRTYGTLTCLRQRLTLTVQTTCLDRAGYLVSWSEFNGTNYTSRASLVSWSRRLSPRAFSTLGAPTVPFLLPPA